MLSDTRVYIASAKELEDEGVFLSLYKTVSKERQKKIDRLRFPKDKRLSLAAEVLLKKALSENGIYEFKIQTTENGKPYLISEPSMKFNLSHSEERVMCVLSLKEVGCDVERMKETDYKMAGHFFAAEECSLLDNVQEGKQELFFRLWTLKESFMKATGLGMKLSLKDFHFTIDGEQVHVCQKVNGEQYYFREYKLEDGYRCAVCSLEPEISDVTELHLTDGAILQ